MALGPIVQEYAFGHYWTGFPMGKDLTDNKILISVIAWGLAIFFSKGGKRPAVILVASLILLSVYMIPHSMKGSELNYDSGKVITSQH